LAAFTNRGKGEVLSNETYLGKRREEAYQRGQFLRSCLAMGKKGKVDRSQEIGLVAQAIGEERQKMKMSGKSGGGLAEELLQTFPQTPRCEGNGCRKTFLSVSKPLGGKVNPGEGTWGDRKKRRFYFGGRENWE